MATARIRFSHSPITWFVAAVLLLGAGVAAGLFLRTDFGYNPIPSAIGGSIIPEESNAPQPIPSINSPTMLIVALGDKVQITEFSNMERCAEAATYIRIGTDRRATAQCVTK